MSTLSIFLGSVFCLCVGLFIGHFSTKAWYKKVVDMMTIKNQQLTERVKKAESIILHDLLQLSPDDINLLAKNLGDDTIKPVIKE